jgi:hypothetical protein
MSEAGTGEVRAHGEHPAPAIGGDGNVVAFATRRGALGRSASEGVHATLPERTDMTDDITGNEARSIGPTPGPGIPRRSRAVTRKEETAMTAIEWEPATAADLLHHVSPDVLRRIALAHRRARRLLDEATLLVREQVELESAVGGRAVADDDVFYELREATGLVALDSVLGNAAAMISAAGGGLWCGGGPRPWPETAWQLPDPDRR